MKKSQQNANTYVSFEQFLREYNIKFASDEKANSWLKNQNPDCLIRIGNSYFIKRAEMIQVLQRYLNEKERLRKLQKKNAKQNFAKNKLKRNITRPTKEL